jgi:hypothetical protein
VRKYAEVCVRVCVHKPLYVQPAAVKNSRQTEVEKWIAYCEHVLLLKYNSYKFKFSQMRILTYLFTLKVGRLGIAEALSPEFPAMTSGFGDPDFGTVDEELITSEASKLGVVELDAELFLDLRVASSVISSTGRRIGVFGVDSVSRNLTKASAKLKSTFPSDSEVRPGIMLRKYLSPYPIKNK